MWLVLLALVVALVVVFVAVAFAAIRGVRAYRDTRTFLRALGEALDELGRAAERLASYEPPELEPLTRASARLRGSRAQLSLLLGALGRVRGQWTGLATIYPRK